MTIQEIIDWFGSKPNLILGYYLVIFVISLIGLVFVNHRNFKSPVTYLYSILIYSAVIPGLLSLVLILYSFFFLKISLLQLDLITYFVPVVATFVILVLINKTISISKIPGFGRLSGLFIIILISFGVTYLLQRMFFGVFFIGKIEYLIAFFLILLVGVKIAWDRMVK